MSLLPPSPESLLRQIAQLQQRISVLEATLRQRDEAEAARAEAECRYHAIVETMNEALSVADAADRIVYVNRRFCELLGYSADALIGRPVAELFPEDLHPMYDQQRARRRQGEASSYEAFLLHKDGRKLPVEVSCAPIVDGNQYRGSVALITEISRRRQAEEMLRIQRDLAIALGTTSDLHEATQLLLDAVMKAEGIHAGGIYLVDHQARLLNLIAHRGVSQSFVVACAQFSFESPLGQLVLAGQAAYQRLHETAEADRNLLAAEGARSVAVIPVQYKGRVIASLTLISRTLEQLPSSVCHALEEMAGQMAGVLIRVQTETALQESRDAVKKEQHLLRQLLELQERDRELVAYEIHDGLAQLVTGALYRLQHFRDLQHRDPQKAEEALSETSELLQRSVKEARSLISGLRPPDLGESGVVAAIQSLIAGSRAAGKLQIDFYPQLRSHRLPGTLESTVFRIVQEALTNAIRHSQSDRVRIDLIEEERSLRIEVRDWGAGFDPERVAPDRFGLRGIRDRARLLGGRAVIQSALGRGTQVLVRIPLPTISGPTPEPPSPHAPRA